MNGKQTGWQKFLTSSKFQVALLAIGFIYLAQILFGLSPETAATTIMKIAVGYFGARVLEPIVDKITGGVNNGEKS